MKRFYKIIHYRKYILRDAERYDCEGVFLNFKRLHWKTDKIDLNPSEPILPSIIVAVFCVHCRIIVSSRQLRWQFHNVNASRSQTVTDGLERFLSPTVSTHWKRNRGNCFHILNGDGSVFTFHCCNSG